MEDRILVLAILQVRLNHAKDLACVFDYTDNPVDKVDDHCEMFANSCDSVKETFGAQPGAQTSYSDVRNVELAHLDVDQVLRDRIGFLEAIMHDLIEEQASLINEKSLQVSKNQQLNEHTTNVSPGENNIDDETQQELQAYRDYVATARIAQRKINTGLRMTAEKAKTTQAELSILKTRVDLAVRSYKAQFIRYHTDLEEVHNQIKLLSAQNAQLTDKIKELQEQLDMELIERFFFQAEIRKLQRDIGELPKEMTELLTDLQQRQETTDTLSALSEGFRNALNIALLENSILEAENRRLKSASSSLQTDGDHGGDSSSSLIHIDTTPVSTGFCPADVQVRDPTATSSATPQQAVSNDDDVSSPKIKDGKLISYDGSGSAQ